MNKKIIVVEDDPAIQETLALAFAEKNYDLTILPNGETILNNEYQLPDLFILDKQLSGVDGLDICRYLKSNAASSHIPVIIISASPSIVRLARLAGADDAVMKPYKLAEIREAVARQLG